MRQTDRTKITRRAAENAAGFQGLQKWQSERKI
jgi:hypothetical protein